MDTLPDYLKCCYLALHNFVNETAADIEKDHGWDATALFRKEVVLKPKTSKSFLSSLLMPNDEVIFLHAVGESL